MTETPKLHSTAYRLALAELRRQHEREFADLYRATRAELEADHA